MSTINEIRKRTGLSQAEFAELVGIPKKTIQKWEQGVREPKEYWINILERYLELTYFQSKDNE